MNQEQIIEKLDQVADTPNSIRKIRELILQLATRGRLVEQSQHDEPASKLASRIDKHIDNLRGQKKFRSTKIESLCRNLLPVLPSSWEWVRLGNVVEYGSSDKSASSDIPEDTWLLDLEDIEKDTSKIIRRKLFRDNPSKSTKTAFAKGDVLYGKLRPYLNKVVVADAPGYCTTEIIPIRTFGFIDPSYVCYALKRPEFIEYATSKSYGMNLPRLGTNDALRAPFPLPPLAEQKRIVAKVDELMALCDQLEAQLKERGSQQVKLAHAALTRFATDPTPANLEFLFHQSYDVAPADLRKAILTLAVQGKLVPQDPNDESVEKTFPKLHAVSVEAKSDKYPSQWLRVPMGKLGEWRSGGTPSKSRTEFWRGNIPWVSPKDMKSLYIGDAQDHISSEAVENSSAKLIPPGSLLMVVRGMILARTFPVALSTREVTINQDMKALIPSDPRTIDFLLLASRAFEPKILDAIEHSSHGTCKLKTAALHELHMPIPPLGEQRRIVAKANALLALVDELEDYQKESKAKAEGLLAALVIAIAVPQSLSVVAESKPQGSQTFIHPCVFLAAEITDRLHDHNTFGQTKLQKVVYLAEYCLQLPEVESSYVRYQRGPHDPGLIERIEAGLFENQWFEVQTRSEGIGKQYSRLGGDERYHDLVRLQWQGKAKEIRDLADMLRNWSSEECEIFATLFAAWNDFIIHGEEVTDEKIINEVLYNWHEEKQRISKPTWQNRLDWMKAIGFIPTGYGKPTKPKPQPRLF